MPGNRKLSAFSAFPADKMMLCTCVGDTAECAQEFDAADSMGSHATQSAFRSAVCVSLDLKAATTLRDAMSATSPTQPDVLPKSGQRRRSSDVLVARQYPVSSGSDARSSGDMSTSAPLRTGLVAQAQAPPRMLACLCAVWIQCRERAKM